MIAIIDYGAGNLRSVQKAFEAVGAEAAVTADRAEIDAADGVVLPGVGAFGDCMHSIQSSGLEETVKAVVKRQTPFLGICLGLQLLFEESEETPGVSGLGLFAGKIVRIPAGDGLKIPHMGWNSLCMQKNSRLLHGLPKAPFVYFVHSYYMQPADTSIVSATTQYGAELPVALEDGNVFATQFHPEKSGDIGLQILKNFANFVTDAKAL